MIMRKNLCIVFCFRVLISAAFGGGGRDVNENIDEFMLVSQGVDIAVKYGESLKGLMLRIRPIPLGTASL